jgi:hypothetical protein
LRIVKIPPERSDGAHPDRTRGSHPAPPL